jgi:adenine-specific DNA-methyltransferase
MKAIYQPYYTKSEPIVKYMVDMLDIKNGMRVLEPCAGDGVFVDALNSKISNLSIDIFELDPVAIKILRDKYEAFPNIAIYHGDTLTDHRLSLYAKAGGIV